MHTGAESMSKLPALLQKVDEFVERTNNSTKTETMDLVVESYALRKELAKCIYEKHRVNNVFSEHRKGFDQFFIKRWVKREHFS